VTLRIGLLAASQIAPSVVVEPARGLDGVEIAAVAARSPRRAQEFAAMWGIPRWFGSYEALLASDAIDAVYVSTPAALHREWSVASIAVGKHVLVEKPLAANAMDAGRLAAAADESDVVVMEAFHWRYHPLAGQMQSILDGDDLGDIHYVEAAFEVGEALTSPSNIRYVLELGGGATLDNGVYPLGWCLWVMGQMPQVVGASALCPVPGIDGRLERSCPGPAVRRAPSWAR
jgi:predicted dehydrogenase